MARHRDVSQSIAIGRTASARVFAAIDSVLVAAESFARVANAAGSVTYSLSVPSLLGLSRATVACTVTVTETRSSTNVTISGKLATGLVSDVVAAISALNNEIVDVHAAEISTSEDAELSNFDSSEGHTQVRSAYTRTLYIADLAPIALRATVVIGRDPTLSPTDGAGALVITVNDRSVSKTHAAIGVDDDGVWVEDRHSTNGTWVGDAAGSGANVTPGERERLRGRSVIRCGATVAKVI